jgi:hypothetical protein
MTGVPKPGVVSVPLFAGLPPITALSTWLIES